MSDASSEEWSDISDDSSSESDSGTGDIVTHMHAPQPLSNKISAKFHDLSTVWIPSTLASCLQHIYQMQQFQLSQSSLSISFFCLGEHLSVILSPPLRIISL